MWVLSTPSMARFFQRVVVFERGRPVEDGDFDTLAKGQSNFAAMLVR
jgi:putative ABC transport system ATP-binding protein